MTDYAALHQQSIAEPEAFWAKQADLIDWIRSPDYILDTDTPTFARWFVGGQLNLCANAVDRWAARQPDQNALIHVSTETGSERVYSYADVLREVNQWAAALRSLGVGKGDRVLIYLPMIPEAVFAMLGTVRLGAIHSVVFGGFASAALATRIDDAMPTVIVAADAGSRGGKVLPYKPLLDEALAQATHRCARVVIVDRGLAGFEERPGELRADMLLAHHEGDWVEPVAVEANEPSYILYTSGTTGQAKGVQRDTGGHAVALAASMRHIFLGQPGQTFFAASDIGWVVGHSYIVYGPMLAGMATVLFEGMPLHPDPGILWRIVERFRVRTLFTAPTTLRLLRQKRGPIGSAHDLSSLDALFVAGEPLDAPTLEWIREELPAPVFDNYWQTETGWPILTICRGLSDTPVRAGSAGLPVYGYDVQLLDLSSGKRVADGQKGVVTIAQPLPPGTASTIWRDPERFAKNYFRSIPGSTNYSTFDWGVRDAEGYVFILGRADDVINVAGHRLGTREIEEVLSGHSAVAEAAVVGVSDEVRNQVPIAFVVAQGAVDGVDLRAALLQRVTQAIGGIARPAHIYLVKTLPKTRSGKVMRRLLQALCEGSDLGSLATIDDPDAIAHVRAAIAEDKDGSPKSLNILGSG